MFKMQCGNSNKDKPNLELIFGELKGHEDLGTGHTP